MTDETSPEGAVVLTAEMAREILENPHECGSEPYDALRSIASGKTVCVRARAEGAVVQEVGGLLQRAVENLNCCADHLSGNPDKTDVRIALRDLTDARKDLDAFARLLSNPAPPQEAEGLLREALLSLKALRATCEYETDEATGCYHASSKTVKQLEAFLARRLAEVWRDCPHCEGTGRGCFPRQPPTLKRTAIGMAVEAPGDSARPAHRTEEVSRSLDAIEADCETGSRIWNQCVKIRKALEQPAHSSEQDRRDAERYRWLRDEAPIGIGEMSSVRQSHSSDEIDAAIDAFTKWQPIKEPPK